MLYAIAHVRGGGECGRAWYEKDGRKLRKRNTFEDFVACAQHLVDRGVTAPSMLAAEGRSAGGLLMGAVANMRPDLFRVVVAGVPFVDVLTTMSDPSLPLTVGEYPEWGNPGTWKYHAYIRSYSPTDCVVQQPYPTMVITAGLSDTRVGYWEPAKWAVLLRRAQAALPDPRPVLAKFDLEAGHFSSSGRYKSMRERAWEMAIVLQWIAGAGDGSKL